MIFYFLIRKIFLFCFINGCKYFYGVRVNVNFKVSYIDLVLILLNVYVILNWMGGGVRFIFNNKYKDKKKFKNIEFLEVGEGGM